MKIFLNWRRLGGPAHCPSCLRPWCWSPSGRWRAGPECRAGDDGLAVEMDVDGVAADGDLEGVPLAHGFVGLGPGCHGGTESGGALGSVRIPYISPEPIGQHQILT